jgi:hypothetical protein
MIPSTDSALFGHFAFGILSLPSMGKHIPEQLMPPALISHILTSTAALLDSQCVSLLISLFLMLL